METRLLILGAGGHGNAVAEAAQMMGQWTKVAFLDDGYPQISEIRSRHPVLSRVADFKSVLTPQDECFVAIGNQGVRQRLLDELQRQGVSIATIIHPRAWVSPAAVVGVGAAVMAGAVVGCHATVGRGVIINANATVDHDAVLEDFAHLGVGVQLAGGVIVRTGAWLQAGACAGYRVVVSEHVIVEPGTALKEA